MAESGQQLTRANLVDADIRKASKQTLPDVPSTLSVDELARLYDVTKPHPYEDVLDELELADDYQLGGP